MTALFVQTLQAPTAGEAQDAGGQDVAIAGGAADRFGAAETTFIAERDSFYLASVSATGWPYIQHRGGPTGFLRALDDRTLAFADFRGNRQYLTLGNLRGDERVALFLMDYPRRRRLKILARMRAHDLRAEPELAALLATPGYRGLAERGFVLKLHAFDWNCPQHIAPRFGAAEVEAAVAPLHARLLALEAENARLRAERQSGV